MSGIAAAAQSAGCCCRPAPNVGCSLQLLGQYLASQPDRWDELSVDVTGTATYYAQDLPGQQAGVPCACYGGTVTASSALRPFFMSRSPGVIQWLLRSEPVIGSHTSIPNQCYADVTCCRFTDWWPPCNQQICVDMGVPDGIRPVTGFPHCNVSQGVTSACGNCPTGAQPYYFTNYHPMSGDVLHNFGRLYIEPGVAFDPCGAPVSGTPVRWILEIGAAGRYVCNGITTMNAPGGFSARYVKPCCSYLDGPVGVYQLQGTYGSTTQTTPCSIRQTSAQFSPTATVREVPS